MVLYHVTSKKKFLKYLQSGQINAPVRAWKSVEEAERFSKQTHRRIIVRLKSDETFIPYEGHKNMAMISHKPYKLEGI